MSGHQTPTSRVVDIGRLGYDFREHLTSTIQNDPSYEPHLQWVIQNLYDTTLNDLIRIIGLGPIMAVEELSKLPYHDVNEEVIKTLNPDTFSEACNICQHFAFEIYQRVRTQIPFEETNEYVPIRIGSDYMVMRLVEPT